MTDIYVPIRAFGDFAITTAVVKNHFAEKPDIILPGYLRKLYDALDGDKYYNIVDTMNINTSPAFFELHKIRTAKQMLRLTNEVLLINKHLKRKHRHFFDYRNRRLNIFLKRFTYPDINGNIYTAKIELLGRYLKKKAAADIVYPRINTVKRAIIFPGSRKAIKVVDTALVKKILGSGLFETIDYAYHESENPLDGSILFSDITGLKEIIMNYDIIISADSLPIHLAYFFNKPHFCIYNDLLGGKWLTPYMLENQFYTVYAGNAENTFRDIKNKLT